jgi:hypothetical protein
VEGFARNARKDSVIKYINIALKMLLMTLGLFCLFSNAENVHC